MNKTPEVLQLADILEIESNSLLICGNDLSDVLLPAAAELRRQNSEIESLKTKVDELQQTLNEELDGNLRLRELGGARSDEPMTTFVERVIDERNALHARVGKVEHELYLAVTRGDTAEFREHYARAQFRILQSQRDALLEASKVALSIIGFGKEYDQISAAIDAAKEKK